VGGPAMAVLAAAAIALWTQLPPRAEIRAGRIAPIEPLIA